MKNDFSTTKTIFATVAGFLWVIANMVPAFSNGTSGIVCLLMGWTTIFDGEYLGFFAWAANFPGIIGWWFFLFAKENSIKGVTIALSSIAFVMSLGCFAVTEIDDTFVVGAPERVHPSYGAYLWVGSFCILLIGSIVQYVNNDKN